MKIILFAIVGLLIISNINSIGMKINNNDTMSGDISKLLYKKVIDKTIIYVDDDGGADYTNIQDAINAASNDDTIFVYNGIYNENINIDKRIILEGENKEFTVINGGEFDSVIKVNSDNVVISGFTITNCSNSSDYAGIMINSDHIEVNDCNISYNKGYGIICRQITDVLINNNLVSNNYYNGINLESVENSEISDNIIKDHIYWYYSYGGTVPLSHGLYLDNANTITVSNNDFSDALNVDLVLLSSTNIKVENNRFISRAGVVIWGGYNHWNSHTFNDNTVNDKPIYYYKNNLIGKTVPEDAGEVILANCRNFKIHNLSIHDGDVGISIGYCSNTEIMNNVIENVAEGIYIDNSDYSFVAGNNVYNVWGVPFLYSCNNTFINNVIDSNFRYGLGLWYGSDYNLVYNNLIFNCSEDGIISYESNFNQIVFNTVSGNNQSGFEIVVSDNNEFSGNIISDNNEDGVKLNFGSTGNIFHHNNFVNNSLKNARSGYGNFWDFDLYGGNFWSDYSGVDVDGDGFGDEPYVIVGNNMDNYPYINPIIFNNPFKPDVPVGPLSGRLHDDIVYTFCGFDPFDYDLFYMVDWGDNSDYIWHGPYCSGESVNISHSWSSQGDFNICVKTKNIIGIESEWSDPLFVSMPRNYIFKSTVLMRLFEIFLLKNK
jgi:parallel beta-helix repeat protein